MNNLKCILRVIITQLLGLYYFKYYYYYSSWCSKMEECLNLRTAGLQNVLISETILDYQLYDSCFLKTYSLAIVLLHVLTHHYVQGTKSFFMLSLSRQLRSWTSLIPIIPLAKRKQTRKANTNACSCCRNEQSKDSDSG